MSAPMVHVDSRALERELGTMGRTVASRRWIGQSTNLAATKTGVEAGRRTRKKINLKARDVKKAIGVRRGLVGTGAAVVVRGIAVPLVLYTTTSSQKVGKKPRVRVKAKKQRVVVKGHFFAQMRSGHVGIFARRSRKQLPIDERFGPDVYQIINDAEELAYLTKFGQTVLFGELNRRLQVLLRE